MANEEVETINIDICDTVPSITDKKLEYNASTQGPSFADLFADVQPLEVLGADGDHCESTHQQMPTLNHAQETSNGGIIDGSSKIQSGVDIRDDQMQDIGHDQASLIGQPTSVNDRENQITHNGHKRNSPSPDIIALSTIIGDDDGKVNREAQDEFDFDLTTVVKTTSVTVETEASRQQQQLKVQQQQISVVSSKDVGDSTVFDAADVSNVDLNELLKSQVGEKKQEKDDFDDEFDFETPTTQGQKPTSNAQSGNFVPSGLTSTESKPRVKTEQLEPDQIHLQSPSVSSGVANDVKPKTSLPESQLNKEYTDSNADDKDESGGNVEDEWAHVQTVTPTFGDSTPAKAGHAESSKIINYHEALQVFLDSNLDQYKGKITRTVHRSGFKRLKHALFGPPKLHHGFAEQRDQYLCMAQYQFVNSNTEHVRMLQTINKRLTGAKFDCPRYGSHWEHIGFQGNDPSTDLRGCGMLGLLQLIYISTTPKYLPLTREMYRLSLHETQNFPFCIMAINMSRMTVQALREECINKEINRQRDGEDLLSYMMRFYTATFYHLYSIWKSQHKTIADTGFVLNDVEAYIKKHPARLLENLEQKVNTKNTLLQSEALQDEPLQFTKFDDD